ncbi:translesion DNA synthesis-associated protein ImuA [Massilia sp. DJPM01]|uniref:translesion DNA synthesis-associated protein ImuA n=1 Tax=Massilia sp. DJPM01 TaxID=3024404 RepID=UPI00259ED14B|nr:translesion DNA synthesis-associated protein ImuA [Massilia sp. DJPM01]MDM5181907.1 translesion DNA synthesis-associated protein ImuA [Massilia sp. DJPM01]
MISPNVHPQPEELHPSLWRASQLARCTTRCIDTGHAVLSKQLPNGGWPTGTLVDLLVQQPGIGEIRLLAPALRKVAHKSVVFLQPPHAPQAIALAGMGLAPSQLIWLIWLKSATSSDALWAAEQVLRSGSCGALLFWSTHVRPESLRRLHLAAQARETLFFALRPLAASQDASPAPLRLSLRPAPGGIEIGFLKRRGPQRDEPLFLPLAEHGKALSDRQVSRPAPVAAPAPTRLAAEAGTRSAREEVGH